MVAVGTPSRMMQGFALIVYLHVCLLVAPSHSKYMVCYYSNWAQYRPSPGTYTVTNIEAQGCSHMIFAFAQVKDNVITSYEANDEGYNSMWHQFTALKSFNVNVKVLLAVGGYNHNSQIFSDMAASPDNRTKFINSVIILLRFWKFDGLDLDWEYPGDSPADKDNLSTLVQELREAFDREAVNKNTERLLLSAAVPAGIARLQRGYNIPVLNRYLDFFNVMCYDYHGQWENETGFTSPMNGITPNDTLNVVSTMNYYLEQGASKTKLVLGMALYGRTFTLKNSGDSAPGSPVIANGGIAGTYTREPGVLSHYEVCNRLKEGYTERLDPIAQIKYAFKDNQWINYEDQSTLNIKIDYLLAIDLAGAMIWALDHDDFGGNFCGMGRYPLMTLISSRVLNVPLSAPTTTVGSPVTTTTAETATTTSTATTTAATSTATTAATSTATTSTSTAGSELPTGSTIIPTRSTFSQCPEMFGMFPESTSCRKFYLCRHGVPFEVSCSDDKIFDRQQRKCVTSTVAC